MLTVAEIARVCHEANQVYCEALGDDSQVPWEDSEAWQRESSKAGVVDVLTGSAKTPEEQHTEWGAHKVADGWGWGKVKDAEAKTHPCLVPWAELDQGQQAKDKLFQAIVKALSNEE